MAPPTTTMTTKAQSFAAVRGGDQGGPENFRSPQLATARRWVKKKVPPLFTSKVSRVQPVYRYVVEISSRSGTARQRFESLFFARGVPLTPFGTRHEQNNATAGAMLSYVHREVLRLASIPDDLFLKDRVNIFLSGEYIIRRLYGLEEVLRLHGSKQELEDANWAAADAYDLPELVDRMPPPLLRAHAEARKRLRLSRRRRAVLKKWVRRADLAARFGERSFDELASEWLNTTQWYHSWRRLPRSRRLPRRSVLSAEDTEDTEHRGFWHACQNWVRRAVLESERLVS